MKKTLIFLGIFLTPMLSCPSLAASENEPRAERHQNTGAKTAQNIPTKNNSAPLPKHQNPLPSHQNPLHFEIGEIKWDKNIKKEKAQSKIESEKNFKAKSKTETANKSPSDKRAEPHKEKTETKASGNEKNFSKFNKAQPSFSSDAMDVKVKGQWDVSFGRNKKSF